MEDQTTENTVEAETTTPSSGEEQTIQQEEKSEVGTLDQPTAEEKPSRAQSRIHELSSKLKEVEERASYWETLASRNEEPAPTAELPEEGELTVEQAAELGAKKALSAITKRQEELSMKQAQQAMAVDAASTIEEYPVLAEDDELANIVFATAQAQGISMKTAARKVMARFSKAQEDAHKKVVAEQAAKSGASTPSGERVAGGPITTKPDIKNLSDSEEAANWNSIISSYSGQE